MIKLINKIYFALFIIVLWGSFLYMSAQIIESDQNIKVMVSGYPELTRIYTVPDNGVVNISQIGQIPVVGLDLSEFQNLISDSYQKIYPQAVINVELTDEHEINYEIYGAVAKPGYQTGTNYTSLQSALINAGGELELIDLNNLVIMRGNKRTIYNMNVFLENGDMVNNPKLKDHDVIFVPKSTKESSVQVFGAVNTQGFVSYKEGLTLIETISLSGGFSDKADLKNILLIRNIKNVQIEEKINLEKIFKEKKFNEIPEIKPGDLILVRTKTQKWKNFLSYLDMFSREVLLVISIILTIDNLNKK